MNHRSSLQTKIYTPDAAERQREWALREQFATFWQSAQGDLRTVYDRFISACPLAGEIHCEHVSEGGIDGWWVRPQRAIAGQAILYIHGGGYVLGSAQAYRGFASQITSRTGLPVFVIDYPLAPEATLPSAPEAALRAWHWLRRQGYSQIAVVGDSAGGGLALVTLAQLRDRGEKPVAGAVFSPWTDLAFSGSSMTDPAVADPLISHEYLRDCAAKYAGSLEPTDPLASPLYANLHGLPPLLLQVGTDERLLDDTRQFAQRAHDAGVPVQLEIWEGMHHVFQLDVTHLESSRTALDHTARFLLAAFDGSAENSIY